MPEKTPISLIIDDPCPLIHVYREHVIDVHHDPPMTKDGRPLREMIPNDFLDRFCDVIERWGIKGKYSIVPSPAGKGDVVRGIGGFDPALTRAWVDTINRRVTPLFDICSEGITHDLAVNLQDGGMFDESENDWSQRQNRETLTPYLIHQLTLLRDAGIDATGVTSPWVFGTQVETEYIAAIVAAQKAVYDRDFSWYFLHMILYRNSQARPWIAFKQGPTTLVSIPGTMNDHFWQTIDSPRTDRAYIRSIADRLVTTDGQAGDIAAVMAAGGWPILVTHWQSLFSNGLET